MELSESPEFCRFQVDLAASETGKQIVKNREEQSTDQGTPSATINAFRWRGSAPFIGTARSKRVGLFVPKWGTGNPAGATKGATSTSAVCSTVSSCPNGPLLLATSSNDQVANFKYET